MNRQGVVDLIDGGGDVFADALLSLNFGCAEHLFEQSPGFPQPVVRERLRFVPHRVTADIHAQQLRGGLNLVHGLLAMTFVITIAGGQNEIGPGERFRFRKVAIPDGLELVLAHEAAA